MKGSQFSQFSDLLQHSVGDQFRSVKLVAPVDDATPNGIDRI